MEQKVKHSWNLCEMDAIKLQQELSLKVIKEDKITEIKYVQIKLLPQLIVCDGQGIAHLRRFGLASHLGVLLDIPTIGCGKTKLLGEFKDPGLKRGAHSPLVYNCEVIGSVLRTQDNIKPIFVSIGHRVSSKTACEWILKLSPRYRLPETTRQLINLLIRFYRTFKIIQNKMKGDLPPFKASSTRKEGLPLLNFKWYKPSKFIKRVTYNVSMTLSACNYSLRFIQFRVGMGSD